MFYRLFEVLDANGNGTLNYEEVQVNQASLTHTHARALTDSLTHSHTHACKHTHTHTHTFHRAELREWRGVGGGEGSEFVGAA